MSLVFFLKFLVSWKFLVSLKLLASLKFLPCLPWLLHDVYTAIVGIDHGQASLSLTEQQTWLSLNNTDCYEGMSANYVDKHACMPDIANKNGHFYAGHSIIFHLMNPELECDWALPNSCIDHPPINQTSSSEDWPPPTRVRCLRQLVPNSVLNVTQILYSQQWFDGKLPNPWH